MRWIIIPGSLAALVLAVSACQAAAPAPVAAPAPTVAASTVAHRSLADHAAKPKRLETMIQVNMFEMNFANPEGEKNPTFRLPAGKTVGIHLHNEGGMVHEFAIGRGHTRGDGYDEVLMQKVPMDVFFYYGEGKAELEGATFGEMEVDKGISDTWLRTTFPAEFKGEWEIGCFVEGHYDAGMHTKLIIE